MPWDGQTSRPREKHREASGKGIMERRRLVGATALLDDAAELLELALGAEERAKL